MNEATRLAWAIENNVHWYDALCETHAVPGEHHATYWINRHTVPPYMSNLITLCDGPDTTAQVAAIRSLIDAETHFGVKDSFQCLSLSELGLQILFRAAWIFRPEDAPSSDADSELSWRVVRTPLELQAWERTWRGVSNNHDAAEKTEIFRPALLRRTDFRFLLGERRGRAVATAALNRSGHAVGISNVFGASEERAQLFRDSVRLAHSIFPGLPLVGYERDDDLAAVGAAGFETLHGLTVWIRTPA